MISPEERKKKILEMLSIEDKVEVNELAELFDTSRVTIRNDLRELEKEKNWIKRTYGGAIVQGRSKVEMNFTQKERRNIGEKQCIAKKAIEFIHSNESIVLDSGTTTLQIAKELKKLSFERLTVVTNNLLIATELVDLPFVELIVTGGVKRENSYSLIGPLAEATLNGIHADKVFLGTAGFSNTGEFMTPSVLEAEAKRKMMAISNERIVVTDSTKFDKISFAIFAKAAEIDYVITDSGINKDIQQLLGDNGVINIVCNK